MPSKTSRVRIRGLREISANISVDEEDVLEDDTDASKGLRNVACGLSLYDTSGVVDTERSEEPKGHSRLSVISSIVVVVLQ